MAESLRLRETTTDPGLRATSGEGALRQDGFTPSLAARADTITSLKAVYMGYLPNRIDGFGNPIVDAVVVNWSASSTPTTIPRIA